MDIKHLFVDKDIVSGQSVTSGLINFDVLSPDGRFAIQYTKEAGGGKLKVTYSISVNGSRFDSVPDEYPIVDEVVALDGGLGLLNPPMAPFMKVTAEAVDGDISNLNLWMAVQ